MTDDNLKTAIRRAKQKAVRLGPNHTLWSTIFDAEAILSGRRSVLSRADVERELGSIA